MSELWETDIKKAISFTIAAKNKIPRNKFNQGGKRSVLRILQLAEEKLNKIQINGSVYCSHV